MPTPWASLGGIVRLDFSNGYAFSLCYAFQGVSEKAIWNAVNFPSASPAPLSFTLPQMTKPFYSYVGVEMFGKLDGFVAYLPHPRLNIVSLLSTKSFEFKPSLAATATSVALKFSSPLLEVELLNGDIMPKIGLLQHFLSAYYGYGDFGAVDIHTHPILPWSQLWRFLGKDCEEPEVSPHYDAGQFPAIFKVLLKSQVRSVLVYWNPYSPMVDSYAENRVSTFSCLETEEAPVKADNAFGYIFINGFPHAPSVACSLYDELGRYIMLASEDV